MIVVKRINDELLRTCGMEDIYNKTIGKKFKITDIPSEKLVSCGDYYFYHDEIEKVG
jgi:hypothetical protein